MPPEQAAIFKTAGLRIKTIAQECVPSLRKMPDQNKFDVIPQRGAFRLQSTWIPEPLAAAGGSEGTAALALVHALDHYVLWHWTTTCGAALLKMKYFLDVTLRSAGTHQSIWKKTKADRAAALLDLPRLRIRYPDYQVSTAGYVIDTNDGTLTVPDSTPHPDPKMRGRQQYEAENAVFQRMQDESAAAGAAYDRAAQFRQVAAAAGFPDLAAATTMPGITPPSRGRARPPLSNARAPVQQPSLPAAAATSSAAAPLNLLTSWLGCGRPAQRPAGEEDPRLAPLLPPVGDVTPRPTTQSQGDRVGQLDGLGADRLGGGAEHGARGAGLSRSTGDWWDTDWHAPSLLSPCRAVSLLRYLHPPTASNIVHDAERVLAIRAGRHREAQVACAPGPGFLGAAGARLARAATCRAVRSPPKSGLPPCVAFC